MEDIAIGIDLGTTNSCASYYYDDRLKVLVNNEGGRITPSVVYFTEKNAVIVGEYAKRMAIAKPDYAVFEIKRLVGRTTDDPYVQNNLRYFPFKLDSSSTEPVILIEQQNQTIKKSPIDICAAILMKIKQDVEAKLGHRVDKAVITVPAYFNVNQREVTLAAAKKAGFTVLKLLNEPTAAALSYYIENIHCETENHSLVYDLGGGTFDVAILRRTAGNIDILCVDGDSHLGGQDFDNLIIDYVCDELQNRYHCDARQDRRTMRRLHNHCEDAKKTLSVAEETTIILDGFVKNHDTVEITLTRTQFEAMAEDLFRRTILIVDDCLKNSNVPKSSIKEVILSGGSTRIPAIQQMLSDFFGKTLNKFVNPDECVAEGAALQAAMLSSNSRQQINDIRITDVIPLSLGLANFVSRMTFLIKRNATIPASASSTRITAYDRQQSMIFKVYEGERLDARKNRYLGDMTIYDITPAPPGQCEVVVTMTLDNNGILTLCAKEKLKDNTKDLTVSYTRGGRSEREIKNAVKDAEEHKNEDEEFDRVIAFKEYLLNYCIACIYNFENQNLTTSHKNCYELCKRAKAEAYLLDVKDEATIKKWIEDVKGLCEPVVAEYKFQFMPKV